MWISQIGNNHNCLPCQKPIMGSYLPFFGHEHSWVSGWCIVKWNCEIPRCQMGNRWRVFMKGETCGKCSLTGGKVGNIPERWKQVENILQGVCDALRRRRSSILWGGCWLSWFFCICITQERQRNLSPGNPGNIYIVLNVFRQHNFVTGVGELSFQGRVGA